MSAEEATVNPDGSTTFENAGGEEGMPQTEDMPEAGEAVMEEEASTDAVVYLIFLAALVFALVVFIRWRKSKQESEADSFFSELDGEKFNLTLPAAVDEYYEIKAKCEEAGWEPGQEKSGNGAAGPQRVLAQALMKRCIADIPIVTHIQKESAGMNKLYSQSMCSVKQWRSYQAAEAMVSAEVDEVRSEADDIEPGWSGVIWRQAMQYHGMLKQKHEMEEKAKAAAAIAEEKKVVPETEEEKAARVVAEKRAKELAAEKAAQDLIKQEEREKDSKQAFNGGMKKGFLEKPAKKK